jgi:hypothetical protein
MRDCWQCFANRLPTFANHFQPAMRKKLPIKKVFIYQCLAPMLAIVGKSVLFCQLLPIKRVTYCVYMGCSIGKNAQKP